MRILELISYSRRLLKGRRLRVTMVCLLPAVTALFFRVSEACIYSLLLYFGDLRPLELFSGRDRAQLAIAVFFAIMRWTVCAPMIYGTAITLAQVTGEKQQVCPRYGDILLSRSCYKRGLAAQFWVKLFSLAALAPVVFFGMTAYSLFITGKTAAELFMTAHAVVLTLVSVVMWLGMKLSLAAVPLFLARFPKKSVFSVIISCLRFMKGRRHTLIKLLMVYLPPMLTIVPVPYLLPELLTAYSLSIDIYLKEEEYLEENRTSRGDGASHVPAKLSPRKRRRFKAAADKAQTHA